MSGRRTTNDGDSGSVSTTSDQVEIASKEASKSGTNNAAAGATNRRTSGRRRSEDGSSPPTNSKRSGAATSGNAVASSRRHRSKDSSDDGTVSSKQSAKSSNATEEVDNSGDDKRGSPSRRSRKERESPSMNKTLQSDPTNHISSAFDGGSGSRFDSGAFAQDGFSGLMDAAFATNFADMPANASSAPEGTAFSSALSFDAAFSPDAVKFESAAFGAADFGVADFGASNLDAGLQAFDQTPTFPSQPETVWDKSPLSDVPEVEPAKVILKRKAIMTKSFQGSPVSNPVNGNIIFAATSTNGGVNLHEVDPNRDYIQVAVVPFLTAELREMLAAKYSTTVMGVDTVWKLAAGLQHVQTKEQIAAIVDLKTMEASLTMRVVVVWERVGSIFQLQYVTTPPAGGDFVCDVSTLQVADGLLFVAGSSPKGACIFICKPAVREAWSANFLTGTGSVSAMSVTPSKPYLVVALADKSVTVWTYKSALIRASTKEKTSKRWLFPLCRLEYMTVLMAEKPAYPGTDDDKSGPVWEGKDGPDVGYCTHMAWLPQGPSIPSLLLLVLSFENGFAVFHVDLPVKLDNSKIGFHHIQEPTQSTVVSATPMLSPIAATRWKGENECSFTSWLQCGPHVDPCIAVLLHDAVSPVARVMLFAIHFPTYRKGPLPKSLMSCRILASTTIPKDSALFPSGLLQSSRSLICYSNKKLVDMSLCLMSSSTPASPVTFLSHPVVSNPPGLTSSGDPFLVDAENDDDGILYVFSMVLCERGKSDMDASMLKWSPPMRRIWLCRVVVGDTKETCVEEGKEDRGFGDNEEVTGGAASGVVCEFNHESLSGLTPARIVRCSGRNVCAVLFRPSLGLGADTAKALSLTADYIALVDYGVGKPVIQVTRGRDISFFPSSGSEFTSGLILSVDGSSLTYFHWNSLKECELATSFRPIVGVDSGKDYVDCRRISIFADSLKLNLTAWGTRLRDNRVCFVAGDLCGIAEATVTEWSNLLPNLVSGRSAWIGVGEDVLTTVGLHGDGSGYRNFALATTSTRVLIVSSALTVVAESKKPLSGSSLAPLGSFAVCFSSDSKVRYLCCLDAGLSEGVVATLAESRYGRIHSSLLAVRPDRLILCPCQSGLSLLELGQTPDSFRLPSGITRPALLLEPMVANAVCVGGKQNQSTLILRSVVEKFGRKISSMTHGENEGLGSYGAGLTNGTFAVLNKYKLNHAASWLLTGTVNFDRTANSRVLPPWLPIGPKSQGILNSDAMLHVIANGDSYLSEYVKSPDQNAASTLPRQSDTVAYLCREYAQDMLCHQGKPIDALKTLDISGAESTESIMLQLTLMLEKSKSNKVAGVLKSLGGCGDNGRARVPSGAAKSSSSLAALALSFKMNSGSRCKQGMNADQVNCWMKPLAPSLQRSKFTNRARQRIIGEKDLENLERREVDDLSSLWTTPCNESKHVWNEGPRKEKENLLMLDNIEDWLGRRRPLIFGKEGASVAKDRGEKTLADLLNQDDDSFGGKGNDLESLKDDGWVDGIGEGRSDEANLSGYFRMSEGEGEDFSWRTEGLMDLSPYQNKAFIVGDPLTVKLEQSTSSVDEGEPGKVKSLFDLVFDSAGQGVASGLALPALRGGSLDIGVLHNPERDARQKCSIEFWFYQPPSEGMASEVVLVRRTLGSSADNLAIAALASEKDCVVWELLLRTTGELEFRTCGGSSLLSSTSKMGTDTDDGSKEEEEKPYLAVFERWNHVCLVLTSKGRKLSECFVTMFVKGIEVVSGMTSMLPRSVTEDELNDDSKLTDIMQKSHLLFGLNHCTGFRMTELRLWACERCADDILSFLYEYLTAAEQKKKFKVKIATKNKKGAALGKRLGLAAPKGIGILRATKSGDLTPSHGLSAQTGFAAPPQNIGVSLAPPPKEGISFSLEPPKPTGHPAAKSLSSLAPLPLDKGKSENPVQTSPRKAKTSAGFTASSNEFGSNHEASSENLARTREHSVLMDDGAQALGEDQDDTEDVAATLWDTAFPLSQQLRPSAAAAMIRGPPAARHYGGNRGGLPDFSGVERFGVGGIAVCGSEKTIVFRDNEDPPALTYPIGASGAVVSDQMDDEGSEFLCCFLAKEGRMVVFELRSRTVVVELQMTTKLNYWRYLPPEAAGNTLCFMLVTPVGGFHWKPLEESPRPHQVWKRGRELQGKKVVSYEEGGSNGQDGPVILSRVGLVTVTRTSGGGLLEGWLIPISGDSQAQQVSDDILGACLCQPLFVEDGPFLPLLVTVHNIEGNVWVNVLSITEPQKGSMIVGDVEATQVIDEGDIGDVNYEPPALAMGPLPEVLCVSLSNIVVVILRRKGLVAAFELEEDELNLIAQENVDHFVIDAVMRYSAEVGGAEIVMLLSDEQNTKDGRIVSFCFRSAA